MARGDRRLAELLCVCLCVYVCARYVQALAPEGNMVFFMSTITSVYAYYTEEREEKENQTHAEIEMESRCGRETCEVHAHGSGSSVHWGCAMYTSERETDRHQREREEEGEERREDEETEQNRIEEEKERDNGEFCSCVVSTCVCACRCVYDP